MFVTDFLRSLSHTCRKSCASSQCPPEPASHCINCADFLEIGIQHNHAEIQQLNWEFSITMLKSPIWQTDRKDARDAVRHVLGGDPSRDDMLKAVLVAIGYMEDVPVLRNEHPVWDAATSRGRYASGH